MATYHRRKHLPSTAEVVLDIVLFLVFAVGFAWALVALAQEILQ